LPKATLVAKATKVAGKKDCYRQKTLPMTKKIVADKNWFLKLFADLA
jgi:hypothetical protein